MRIQFGILTLATIGLLALPSAARAQERAWSMYVAGGLSLPSGNLNTDYSTGWHVLAGGWWTARAQPWGMRVEGAYNRFALASTREFRFGGPSERTAFSLSATGTYRIPANNTTLSPYVMAGVGSYWTSCTESVACRSSTNLGWNAGAGARMALLGVQSFVELRYHAITDRGNFFPLTFGVMF